MSAQGAGFDVASVTFFHSQYPGFLALSIKKINLSHSRLKISPSLSANYI